MVSDSEPLRLLSLAASARGLGMIGRSPYGLANTETPKAAFRHRSDMKSHVRVEQLECF
jgi:hypothetical protein